MATTDVETTDYCSGRDWNVVALKTSEKSKQEAFRALGSEKKRTQAEASLKDKFTRLAKGTQLPEEMWHAAFTEGDVTVWRMRKGELRAYAWKSVRLKGTIVICMYVYKKSRATLHQDKIMAMYRRFEQKEEKK